MTEYHGEDRRKSDERISEILMKISEIHMRQNNITIPQLNKLVKTVFGNGAEGLYGAVTRHEESIKELGDIKRYILRSFFGVIFSVIGAVTIAAFLHFFSKG